MPSDFPLNMLIFIYCGAFLRHEHVWKNVEIIQGKYKCTCEYCIQLHLNQSLAVKLFRLRDH